MVLPDKKVLRFYVCANCTLCVKPFQKDFAKCHKNVLYKKSMLYKYTWQVLQVYYTNLVLKYKYVYTVYNICKI